MIQISTSQKKYKWQLSIWKASDILASREIQIKATEISFHLSQNEYYQEHRKQ